MSTSTSWTGRSRTETGRGDLCWSAGSGLRAGSRMVRCLLDGTKAVSFMELEVSAAMSRRCPSRPPSQVNVTWPGGIPAFEDRRAKRDVSISKHENLFDDAVGGCCYGQG
eukprot:754660-Hanusia_phi.AAC.2